MKGLSGSFFFFFEWSSGFGMWKGKGKGEGGKLIHLALHRGIVVCRGFGRFVL